MLLPWTWNRALAWQEELSQTDELLKGMDAFVLEQLGLKLPEEEKKSFFTIRFDSVQDPHGDPTLSSSNIQQAD